MSGGYENTDRSESILEKPSDTLLQSHPFSVFGTFFPKQKQSLSCDDFNHSIAIPFLTEFDIVAPRFLNIQNRSDLMKNDFVIQEQTTTPKEMFFKYMSR